ncbi:MAG: hypothetical protein NCW75_08520 [Phycisphaera sp.]|nr:MAG: hypothetical protein NCW75_08520 [Phycisphaera sp.]
MAVYPQVRLDACLGEGSQVFANRPWLDDHILCIVDGDEQGWRYLTDVDLQEHGGFDAAMVQARQNLAEIAQRPGVVQAFRGPAGQVTLIVIEGTAFVSGLFVEPSFVTFCQTHLGDEFGLCVPAVDELVAFRLPDTNNTAATSLERFMVAEHPVSPHIYTSDGDQSFRVRMRRDYDSKRLAITNTKVLISPTGSIAERKPDTAWWEGQRSEPLTVEVVAQLEVWRNAGTALIRQYGTAPDGQLSPPVLDATLEAWRKDSSAQRCDAVTLTTGLGTLLGNFYCGLLPGEWVMHYDDAGPAPAVRAQSGTVASPIDSITKRLDAPAGSITELCRKILEAEKAS